MSRPLELAALPRLARWSSATRAVAALGGATAVLRVVALAGLGGALVAAPFNEALLEYLAGAGVVAWLGMLAVERRLPDVPRPILIALAGLLAIGFASAAVAPIENGPATYLALRDLGMGLIFVAAADLVRTVRAASTLIVLALAGASASAVVGWLGFIRGTSIGLAGPGRDFTVAGVLRITGTFDYPNSAAMFWEMALLASLPLVLRRFRGSVRAALVAAMVVVGGAMVLTFSRGAIIGAVAGLAVIALLAVRVRRPSTAVLAGVAGVSIVGGMLAAQVMAGMPLARLSVESDADLYRVAYAVPTLMALPVGAEAIIPVTLTNTGAAPWSTEGPHPFRLGYHWLDPRTGLMSVIEGIRTPLPSAVPPGASVEVAAQVTAPDRAGRAILEWDVVQDGVAWLSENGSPAWATTVDVGAVAAGTAPEPIVTGAVDVWPDALPAPTRPELWRAAIAIIQAHPLLGVGPGDYRLVYGTYLGWAAWDQRIHANDLYLELGSTVGLLGLALFVVLIAFVLGRQLRWLARRRIGARDADRWLMLAGLAAALVAFLVHGLVDYFLDFPPTAMLFWTLLGCGLGLALGARRAARVAP